MRRAMQHPDWGLRLAAIESVAAHPQEEYLETLVAALHDPHEAVRALAAIALGQYRLVRVGRHLKLALVDPQPSVRAAAARALGQIPTLRFSRELEKRLADEDNEVRREAARSLGRVGRAQAQGFLRAMAVRDPIHSNREAARQAIAQLERRTATEEDKRQRARFELAQILLDGQRSWEVRKRAKACMIRIGGKSLIPILADALQASNKVQAHVHVVDVLVTLSPCRELQNVLIGLLHHVASRVRRRAIVALGEMGDKQAVYFLNEVARAIEVEPAGLLDLTDAQLALEAVQKIRERTARGYTLDEA